MEVVIVLIVDGGHWPIVLLVGSSALTKSDKNIKIASDKKSAIYFEQLRERACLRNVSMGVYSI